MTQIQRGIFILCIGFLISCTQESQKDATLQSEDMMIRIAEIQIDPAYLDQYLSILKEESETSIRIEPGVISIYPMYEQEHPAKIRILEIYKNKGAYQAHLQTPHFKEYKKTTLNMVKSLKLTEMKAIDEKSMQLIFRKLTD